MSGSKDTGDKNTHINIYSIRNNPAKPMPNPRTRGSHLTFWNMSADAPSYGHLHQSWFSKNVSEASRRTVLTECALAPYLQHCVIPLLLGTASFCQDDPMTDSSLCSCPDRSGWLLSWMPLTVFVRKRTCQIRTRGREDVLISRHGRARLLPAADDQLYASCRNSPF